MAPNACSIMCEALSSTLQRIVIMFFTFYYLLCVLIVPCASTDALVCEPLEDTVHIFVRVTQRS